MQFTVDHASVARVKKQKKRRSRNKAVIPATLTPHEEPASAPWSASPVLLLTPVDELAGLDEAQRRAAEKDPVFAAALLGK